MTSFSLAFMVWWFDFGSMTSQPSSDSLCYQGKLSRDTNDMSLNGRWLENLE